MGEIYNYFKQNTFVDILPKINEFRNDAGELLNKIFIAKEFLKHNDEYNKALNQYYDLLAVEKVKPWQQGSEKYELAKQQIIKTRQSIQLNKYYKDGYELLNRIGHFFNGEWDYTIVLFGETSYTFKMTMEDILSVSQADVAGFRLMDKGTILEKMKETQIERIEWDTEEGLEKGYSTKDFKLYNYAIERGKQILSQGNSGISMRLNFNAGERLEGFLAMVERKDRISSINILKEIYDIAYRRSVKHLGANQFNTLREDIFTILSQLNEQTNQRGFWTGGDTKEHGQIKGENASLFSFSTIENQLKKVTLLFNNLNFEKLQEKVDEGKEQGKPILQEKIDAVLNKLLSGFNAIKVPDASALRDEINSLIDSL